MEPADTGPDPENAALEERPVRRRRAIPGNRIFF